MPPLRLSLKCVRGRGGLPRTAQQRGPRGLAPGPAPSAPGGTRELQLGPDQRGKAAPALELRHTTQGRGRAGES